MGARRSPKKLHANLPMKLLATASFPGEIAGNPDLVLRLASEKEYEIGGVERSL